MSDNNELTEIMADLRAAIAFSKRPGNEGRTLANSKGHYRPIEELLQPAVNTLTEVNNFIDALNFVLANTTESASKGLVMNSIRNEIATFKASLEPRYNAANKAKAALSKG